MVCEGFNCFNLSEEFHYGSSSVPGLFEEFEIRFELVRRDASIRGPEVGEHLESRHVAVALLVVEKFVDVLIRARFNELLTKHFVGVMIELEGEHCSFVIFEDGGNLNAS